MITREQIPTVLDHPVYDGEGNKIGEARHVFFDEPDGETRGAHLSLIERLSQQVARCSAACHHQDLDLYVFRIARHRPRKASHRSRQGARRPLACAVSCG
ncbi:hypothetical protein BGM19_01085 [Streptomyces agglomeratus]|nr:hypothetical protein BGM19_01085 [Streptomyces agglomeratus]